MPLIQTAKLTPGSQDAEANLQTYCGLDCCVTMEVLEELLAQFPGQNSIYSFERALQAPYLEIMQRGFLVDDLARRHAAGILHERISHLQGMLAEFASAVWGKGLNPRSPMQLRDFFYGSMKLPEVWLSQKGERKLSTNREALEKLEVYLYARPFIALILSIRELSKQLEVFETDIDNDGRFRTSYNIAGTECIAGDSLVWTKSGLRSIQEIIESSYKCDVWNGQDFVTPVRKVRYQNQEGFEIELENGYKLKCSSNHPLFTGNGWVQAKDLKFWNSIEINMGLPTLFGQHAMPKGSPISLLSEDLCEFIGMWLADGSLNCNSEHYRCRLSNSDQVVKERWKYLARAVFGIEAVEYGDEMAFSSKYWCQWFVSLGLPADSGLGTARYKAIPSLFLRGKPNLLRALLRGLTLDSHQTEKGVMFGTQSLQLQDQVQQVLLILGIRSVKLQNGDSIKLNIPRAFCGRFLSLIGFVQEEKAKSLARLLNQRCQWHEPEIFGKPVLMSIKSIKPWLGEVFDLTMPEGSPAQYVAQGITVHNTGRPSSSKNAFGLGSNMQNIAPALRYVFVADPGWKLCVIDLEQVEARDVGFFCGCLFGDWSYLNACESGDLHTNNAKLVWPELPWTGDRKRDREIANRNFYRDFSYRDMAKRGSHLSNYSGTSWMMSRALKIPIAIADEFQARYIRGRPEWYEKAAGKTWPAVEPAFPCIPRWWQWSAEQLQTVGYITTPFGRKRHFFGRPGDDATVREAIAFLPQSTTADRMNLGMWRVWKYMPQVQLLAQTYDSITFQYRETEDENQIIGRALELIRVELYAPGRKYIVPGEAKIGWNWGAKVTQQDIDKALAEKKKPPKMNLGGLAKWDPKTRDTRQREWGLMRTIL